MGWGDEIAMAAVREMFEEVGILLARQGSTFAREAECEQVRSIVTGGKTFGEALRELRLEPVLDLLVMFAPCVTPAAMRRRSYALFFLSTLPPVPVAMPKGVELT